MGNKESKKKKIVNQNLPSYGSKKLKPSDMFRSICDRFHTFEELQTGLRECGLESSNLVIGIDFTKSNTWTGKQTFGGKCLHWLDPNMQQLNPYQQAIMCMTRTLEAFDDDHLIPAYGFGDASTKDKSCFPFFPDKRPCMGLQEVQFRYSQLCQTVELSGPTNFAPIIRAAIDHCNQERGYIICLIVADGQVNDERDTVDAIREASHFPISIICVGVGDGPWDQMVKFDDKITGRKFDNFQFVPFHNTVAQTESTEEAEVKFCIKALMEVPDQYAMIRQLGYLTTV